MTVQSGHRRPTESELKVLFNGGLKGDSASYRAFLIQMRALLRQYISRQLFRLRKADQDLEDIVQEALMALHGRRHTYDGETPITAWAYGIARYKLIDNLRRACRTVDLDSLEGPDVCFDDSAQTEARLTVRALTTRLPDALRVPVNLMKLQGMSASETAQLTGTAEATVRVNVHRGLKALRQFCGAGRGTRERR